MSAPNEIVVPLAARNYAANYGYHIVRATVVYGDGIRRKEYLAHDPINELVHARSDSWMGVVRFIEDTGAIGDPLPIDQRPWTLH